MSETSLQISSTLTRALIDNGATNRVIAQGAGVSNRAVVEARHGVDLEKVTRRKRQGVARSFTRLSIFFRLDPSIVLRELHLDPDAPELRVQINRARSDAFAPIPFGDHTLSVIQAREENKPRVGIVNWDPFASKDTDNWSFATAITRGVLGAINPDWRSVQTVPYDDFSEAEELLFEDDARGLDVVVGLYDIPWRLLNEGVEVVTLPGLAMQLAGIAVGLQNVPAPEVGWLDVLSGGGRLPHALAIFGDAGSILLRGAADYPEGLLGPDIKSRDPEKIARRLQYELETGELGIILIADGTLVSATTGILKDAGVTVREIGDAKRAPQYRFGFGVRTDSPIFRDLLKDALKQELFGRALPRTVLLYSRLIEIAKRKGRLVFSRTSLSELDSDLPSLFEEVAREMDIWSVFRACESEDNSSGHMGSPGAEGFSL